MTFITWPPVSTELGKCAFSFYAPILWNSVQSTLKINSLITPGHLKLMAVSQFETVLVLYEYFEFLTHLTLLGS